MGLSNGLALTLATCQAHNTVPICRELAGYLTARLGRPVHFLEDLDWRDAYAAVAVGELDIAWICGRPYVRLIDEGAPIELLAAPVMAGARYGGRPVYFSDVVVRRDSPYHRFADLRGASWAYNEPGSQSGYHITCYHLARLGEGGDFFGRATGSGGHVRSLAMILAGEVDASAIDSTVLEWELTADLSLAGRIRVIDAFGPSPIPPLVVAGRGRAFAPALRDALLALDQTPSGRAILTTGRLARFAPVTDADYDPIRHMTTFSKLVTLQ